MAVLSLWLPPRGGAGGEGVETPWGRAERRPPHARLWQSSYIPLTLQNTAPDDAAEVLSALSFLLPAAQRRDRLVQQLEEILGFGTRVAGSSSPGQQKMIDFSVAAGKWRPPREALFHLAAPPPSPASRWRLEWDKFTDTTPLGPRNFSNIIFNFEGGYAFRRALARETRNRTTPRRRRRRSFAVSDAAAKDRNSGMWRSSMADEKLQHVVLAAHWDSKFFADMEFLGACDSALPVVYLLETMRMITVLSDTSDVLRAAAVTAGNRDVCAQLRQALSPAYRTVLRYYYADDDDFIRCLSGGKTRVANASDATETDAHVAPRAGGDWLRLLRHVDNLPALTVVFFDGEEAFVSWQGEDHTYGSRHLAKLWQQTRFAAASRDRSAADADSALSRLDAIDLFALYDLMGPAGTQFHNYFPDQSGKAFALLAEVEEAHRLRAERLACLSKQLMDAQGTCSPQLPEVWCRHGSPHDMFTIYGVPRLAGPLLHRTDLAELWITPPAPCGTNSAGHHAQNIFFPVGEKWARGPRLAGGVTVEDDHIHWMGTQRVLHLIPWPFPSSWHTARDDGSDIDAGTVVDLCRVLEAFVLRLGEGWMHE
ncbi:putative glutaminyl cyclase [Trypanosoma rangeli]|uniref:Putative glutaminyl cyclase n=1 Tax=Trypanosoma rangeli TaxID=5698 RepID=A0A3R7MBL0_TRYRA|nr:putative glutaminyl cyclase [Trypanosoma rangeli]RNF02877.1 putative glutaminyl cyclase [Trypanosoma rangeli]|eukprot:RNF02877.1 putative glutaminyl cyclase [Trypanosoma rangeli]